MGKLKDTKKIKQIKNVLLQNNFHEFEIRPSPVTGNIELVMGFRVGVSPKLDSLLVRYTGETNGSPEHMTQLKEYCECLKKSGLNAEIKNFPGEINGQTYSHWAIEVTGKDIGYVEFAN